MRSCASIEVNSEKMKGEKMATQNRENVKVHLARFYSHEVKILKWVNQEEEGFECTLRFIWLK